MPSQITFNIEETTPDSRQHLKEPSLSKPIGKPQKRRGRFAPLLTFFLGILVSFIALSGYVYFAGLDRTPVTTPTSAQSGILAISADDSLRLAGVSITKRIFIKLQPYIRSCQLQIHVLHTDFSGIPVTNFVANYETVMNQALQLKASSLPGGFTYCAVTVHTAQQALVIIYSTTSS